MILLEKLRFRFFNHPLFLIVGRSHRHPGFRLIGAETMHRRYYSIPQRASPQVGPEETFAGTIKTVAIHNGFHNGSTASEWNKRQRPENSAKSSLQWAPNLFVSGSNLSY
jgi:hypothetical protein